jgi:hypothetical protein
MLEVLGCRLNVTEPGFQPADQWQVIKKANNELKGEMY